MDYEVLARKWRPRQFDEVVGQDHVTQTLKNAVQNGRIAHAYLFVGPRGIGKTSVARIFSKALNCVEGPTTTPCDKCPACLEIAAGSSLDVLEIDGASNNGVDQVRDLRETVKYAPTRGRYKIYIIDEVHMLSTAAFNALLKTLEEPPGHVKFMFATTEPDKILPTIVSRCQRFDLRRIPVSLMVERLNLIAGAEKVKIDEEAVLAVARGAEGGLRDAESALDQLISFKGKRIREDDVLSVFGLVARRKLEALALCILKGDMAGIIQNVAELDAAGKDLQRLVFELLEHFRNLLICLNVKDASGGMDLTDAQVKALQSQAELTDTARTLRIADVLAETAEKMRQALSRRTLLEVALIRCARAATVVTLEELLARVNALRDDGDGSGGAQEAASGHRGGAEEQTGRGSASRPAPRGTAALPRRKKKEDEQEPGADILPQIEGTWREIVDAVRKIDMKAGGALRDARPVEVDGSTLVVGFDPEFADEMRRMEGQRQRKALEIVLARSVGRKLSVKFREAFEDEAAPRRPASPDDGADAQAQEGAATGKGQGGRNWLQDPAVQKTLDTFRGSIVDVRE